MYETLTTCERDNAKAITNPSSLKRHRPLRDERHMDHSYNPWLTTAGLLSGIAALLHVAIVIGGAPWYRYFGAGERMASAAAAGRLYPAIVTIGIALVLASWAAFAFSGAGLIPALPLLKPALAAITAVYLLRGVAIIPLYLLARDKATPFLVWSSIICILYALVHLLGLFQVWGTL